MMSKAEGEAAGDAQGDVIQAYEAWSIREKEGMGDKSGWTGALQLARMCSGTRLSDPKKFTAL
jgi:hypothetical protein